MLDALFVCESDPRGRQPGQAAKLIRDGASLAQTSCQAEVILDEYEAVGLAMDQAAEGDLLLLLIDDIQGTIQRLKGRSFRTEAPITS
jgi:cyanophycin synthetase